MSTYASAIPPFVRDITRGRRALIAVAWLVGLMLSPTLVHAGGREFTLKDDIGLSTFSGDGKAVFSEDGKYFAITTQRERLDLGKVESTLRVFKTEEVYKSLLLKSSLGPPPVWSFRSASFHEGEIISNVRWTKSDSIAFLCETSEGVHQLMLTSLSQKQPESLTPKEQEITAYDIRNRNSFVYTVLNPESTLGSDTKESEPSFAIAGKDLFDVFGPSRRTIAERRYFQDLSELWVYSNGRRIRISDGLESNALPIHRDGQEALSLSPDGRFVVTALCLSTVPDDWESLYPPAQGDSSPYRIRAGKQDIHAPHGPSLVSEYVVIDIGTGKIRALTDAPIGDAGGWWGTTKTNWSSDGQSILLANTFVKPASRSDAQRNGACVAVADLERKKVSCIQFLDSDIGGPGGRYIEDADFVAGSSNRVIIRVDVRPNHNPASSFYLRDDDGKWVVDSANSRMDTNEQALDVSVRQDMNHPPVLVAESRPLRRLVEVLNPNPQLLGITLAQVTILEWKDKTGREWSGGLYKPSGYEPGGHYPLIIQTHGFDEHQFIPSGVFTTAFAAQELASLGFVVLQVRDCAIRTTPEEGPCQVEGYEAAVGLLSGEGIVDPQRVGIIGFSRTCFYVLEALSTSSVHFAAASITDGVNEGYLQYLIDVDHGGNSIEHEADAIIGAPPIGEGLERWIKRSPEFNLDKVTTPLLIAAQRDQVLFNWEPYAILRYLHRPVEFIALMSEEHVLTNPRVRDASQGSNIDWFRFWLQGYEDPDPKKADQYQRWEHLRELQKAENEPAARPSQ